MDNVEPIPLDPWASIPEKVQETIENASAKVVVLLLLVAYIAAVYFTQMVTARMVQLAFTSDPIVPGCSGEFQSNLLEPSPI